MSRGGPDPKAQSRHGTKNASSRISRQFNGVYRCRLSAGPFYALVFTEMRDFPAERIEVNMDKALETLPEFCGRHSISRTAAYREINDGRLHITKVGRRTLIARVDAEAWLEIVRKSTNAQ